MSRDPTPIERRYIARNYLHCYLNFNVTAKYNKPVSKAQLSQALRTIMLANDNLLLGAFRKNQNDTIEDDRNAVGNNFTIRPVKSVKFDDVVSYEKNNSSNDENTLITDYLSDLSERYIDLNIETPPWRLNVLEANNITYFTFYFDHTFYDGLVGGNFHRDLIDQFAKMESPEFADVLYDQEKDGVADVNKTFGNQLDVYSVPWYYPLVNKINALAIVKAVRKLFATVSYKLSTIGLLQKIFGLRFREDPNIANLPLFKFKPSTIDYPTKFGILSLPPPELASLLSFCKKNGLSFTPLLEVMVVKTIDEIVRPQLTDSVTKYVHLIATGGRRYYPEMKYVTITSAHADLFGPVSTYSWLQLLDFTKSRSEYVRSIMEGKIPFRNQGHQMTNENYWDSFRAFVGPSEHATGAVSSIGNNKYDSGEWRIENMWFSQGNGPGFHFVTNVTSSYAGATICVGFKPEYLELMNGKLIPKFIDQLRNNIEDLQKYN